MKKILYILLCIVMISGCKSTSSNKSLAKFNVLIDSEEKYMKVRGTFVVEGQSFGDKIIQTFRTDLFSKGDVLTFDLDEKIDGCIGEEMIIDFYVSEDGKEEIKVTNGIRIVCELENEYQYKLQGNSIAGYELIENKQ